MPVQRERTGKGGEITQGNTLRDRRSGACTGRGDARRTSLVGGSLRSRWSSPQIGHPPAATSPPVSSNHRERQRKPSMRLRPLICGLCFIALAARGDPPTEPGSGATIVIDLPASTDIVVGDDLHRPASASAGAPPLAR